MGYNEPLLLENKAYAFPGGSSDASFNATQCPATPASGQRCSLHVPWSISRHTSNHLQCLLRANIPTPTLQKNMHVISYAQCSLKIVFLWSKVRTKLDRLSTAHSRWFFSSCKLPLSFLLSRSILLPENHSVCPQNESAAGRQRGREDFCHDLRD